MGSKLYGASFPNAGLARPQFASTPIEDELLAYLVSLSETVLEAAKFTFSGGPISGEHGWLPGGYGNQYTRDLAMMMRSIPDYFSADDMLNALALLSDTQGEGGGTYRISEAHSQAGVTIFAGNALLDNCFEFVDIAYSHFLKTETTAAFTAFKTELDRALNEPGVSNHLVEVTPSMKGYGFQDQVASEGQCLMTSVLRYRAFAQMSEMAQAAEVTDTYAAELPLIRAALISDLWDEEEGLFRNASEVNLEHSIPGSMYAVITGACVGEVAETIKGKIIELKDGIFERGQVRHMPGGVYWTAVTEGQNSPDTFQNGAFWATYSGYAMAILREVSTETYAPFMADLLAWLKLQNEALRPNECTFLATGYQNAGQYVASAVMPYAGLAGEISR